jgi:hypothetical protein
VRLLDVYGHEVAAYNSTVFDATTNSALHRPKSNQGENSREKIIQRSESIRFQHNPLEHLSKCMPLFTYKAVEIIAIFYRCFRTLPTVILTCIHSSTCLYVTLVVTDVVSSHLHRQKFESATAGYDATCPPSQKRRFNLHK